MTPSKLKAKSLSLSLSLYLVTTVSYIMALECDCVGKSILNDYKCDSGFLRVSNTTNSDECERVAQMINALPGVYNVKCIADSTFNPNSLPDSGIWGVGLRSLNTRGYLRNNDYLFVDLKRRDSPKLYWDVLDSIELGSIGLGIGSQIKTRHRGDSTDNYIWVEQHCEDLAEAIGQISGKALLLNSGELKSTVLKPR